MTESAINPAPIRIRKAEHDGVDWLYIYLRSVVSQRTETDMDGEEYTLYTYDDEHIRIPLPDGVDMDVPSDHAANQDALKAQLKALFINNADFRTALSDALDNAQAVDWRDQVSAWGQEPAVSITAEDNWQYWTPGELVEAGDQRYYGDTLYECRQAHQAAGHRNPELTTPTLWLVVPQSDEWVAGARYDVDDVVSYEGERYICIQKHVSQSDYTPIATIDTLWGVYEPQPGEDWVDSGEAVVSLVSANAIRVSDTAPFEADQQIRIAGEHEASVTRIHQPGSPGILVIDPHVGVSGGESIEIWQ
jgi:hypothetical protein